MPENRTPRRFENFDDPSIYPKYEAAVLHADTFNFIVDFDSELAFAALNVDLSFTKNALTTKVRNFLSSTVLERHEFPKGTDFSVPGAQTSENSMDVSHHKQHYLLTTVFDAFYSNIWMPEKQKDLVSVSCRNF